MTSRKFSVQLVEKDFVALNLNVMERSWKKSRSYHYLKFIGFGLLALGLVLSLYDLNLLVLGLPFMLLGLFYSIGMTWLMRVSVKVNVKRLLSQGRTDSILGDFVYRIDDEGFECRSTNGYQGSYWHSFDRLKETDDYLFLFNSSISGYIIPKRELTETEFEECVNLVKKYVAEAQSLKLDDEASTN